MSIPPTRHPLRRLSLCVAVLLAAPLAAQAQGWDTYFGGSLGSSDYNTAVKAFGGVQMWPQVALEGQLLSFGSENYTTFGNTNKRSAWALGASAVGQYPLNPSIMLIGKLGAHYLHSEASGPGLSTSKNSVKLGLGAGALWQINPKIGLRGEFENIGGSSGDVYSIGLQFKL